MNGVYQQQQLSSIKGVAGTPSCIKNGCVIAQGYKRVYFHCIHIVECW